MAKRKMSLKTIMGAIRSPKTPNGLKKGLLKKYGEQLGLGKSAYLRNPKNKKNAPKKWHIKESFETYKEWQKEKDKGRKQYLAGRIDAHNKSAKIGENPRRERPDVFSKHQIKIAKDTLKMTDAGARIMGGMSKEEAREILKKYKISFKENPKKAIEKFKLKRNRLRQKSNNPKNITVNKPELIYDKITAIEATKGKKSHWPNEQFRHDFTSGAKIYGMPDGSIMIKGKKKLWTKKKYSNEDIKSTGGKI